MESFRDLAARRQSCRSFKSDPVAPELLARCVRTASLAPSACNSQPWRFTIVTDAEKRRVLSEITQVLGFNGWSVNVPAFIVVSEIEKPVLEPEVMKQYSDTRLFSEGDVGMATAYLVLEAEDIGLASCIIGSFTNEDVIALLGLPQGDTVRAVVAVGYAENDATRPKLRKPFEEICKII